MSLPELLIIIVLVALNRSHVDKGFAGTTVPTPHISFTVHTMPTGLHERRSCAYGRSEVLDIDIEGLPEDKFGPGLGDIDIDVDGSQDASCSSARSSEEWTQVEGTGTGTV